MISPTQSNPATLRYRRAEQLMIVIVFLTIITIPGLGLTAGIDKATISEAEMRELAPRPTWAWTPDAIAAWPSAFQRYFEDHFAFRNRLIHYQASLLWHALRASSSDTVIAGRDGWLFYADDGGLDDYVQAKPFTALELEAWRETLVRSRDVLKARGIPFLFVIAPDKQMIYPEYMPHALHRLREDYRADQFLAYMRARADVDILDLRLAVTAAKPHGLLYHLYDTHWNDRGGLVAYRAIIERLRPAFPDMVPLSRGDFDAVPGVPSGDKTTMLGLVDRGKVTMPGLVLRRGVSSRVVEPRVLDPYGEEGRLVTEIPSSRSPHLVMFRDSFAGRLIPFLSENFGRAVYLWQTNIDAAEIEREHPDLVIQEFVARHFITIEPYSDLR